MTAFLQEDEAIFNMLGLLLPKAAPAASESAEDQHGNPAAAMQQLLQLQVLSIRLLMLQTCEHTACLCQFTHFGLEEEKAVMH